VYPEHLERPVCLAFQLRLVYLPRPEYLCCPVRPELLAYLASLIDLAYLERLGFLEFLAFLAYLASLIDLAYLERLGFLELLYSLAHLIVQWFLGNHALPPAPVPLVPPVYLVTVHTHNLVLPLLLEYLEQRTVQQRLVRPTYLEFPEYLVR